MNLFRNFILFALVFAMVLPQALALQQLFPLHGRVTGTGGTLVNGDLRVYIFDANSGGNTVYDSGSDYNGAIISSVVDVMLGDKTNLDLNYGSFYYMDIAINNNDLDFNGNERKIFESNRGNDINVTDLKSVNGSIRLSVASDGNVGINTTSAASRLSVYGDVNIANTSTSTPLLRVSSGNSRIGVLTHTPQNTLNLLGDVNFAISGGTGSPSLYVTNDGNVAVNDVFSKNKLHVLGDLNVTTSATAAPSLYINSTDGNISIGAASATSTYRVDVSGFGRFTGDLNVGKKVTVSDVNVLNTFTVSNSSGSPSIFVTASDGNVSIGSGAATSTYRLDVTGFGRFTGDLNVGKKITAQDLNVLGTTTLTGTALVVTDINTSNIGIRTSGGTILFNASTGAERLRITDDGNVGVNASVVKNKLLVIGDLNIVTSATAAPSLFVSSVDGNIGIGTASPGSTFRVDVSGFTRITGDLNVGKKITTTDDNVLGTFTITNSSGTPSLFVTSSDGNVSIGSGAATSTYRVDVSGFGRFTGDLNVGKKVTAFDLNVARTATFQDTNVLGTETLTGDLNIATNGKKIYVRDANISGGNIVNGCAGQAILSSGFSRVSTTCVSASSWIFLTRQSAGSPLSDVNKAVVYVIGGRVAGTNFDINSSYATDANTVAWLIIEPT